MGDESGKYQVGYGKPPAEHQFPKGKSGNPKGRPRGARNKPALEISPGMRPANDLIRHEALRPIPVREGNKLIELPMAQAVLRSLGLNALKGSRLAQRDYMQIVLGREAADYEERKAEFMIAADYKRTWDSKIEQARAAGRPAPMPLPHPDDIILDTVRGEARIEGPQTREQKAYLDKELERRAHAQAEVNRCAEKFLRARPGNTKGRYLLGWLDHQQIFDDINSSIYPRYRATLENRFSAQDEGGGGEAVLKLRKKGILPTR